MRSDTALSRGTVLHCIPSMGGGGAERQLAYLAGPLITLGWDVHVAFVVDGPNRPRLQQSGAVIHQLTSAGSYDPRLAWQIARLVNHLRPTIVQAWFVQMELLAGTVASVAGIPWILSERSSPLAHPASWKNRLRGFMAGRAEAIVSNSAGGDAYWNQRLGDRVRRFLVPNAVPVEEIQRTLPALPHGVSVRSGDALVVAVGRMEQEKNVERVFEACRRVVQRPNTTAILCGEGPLRSAILRHIAAEGLSDRVFAPGFVEELWALLKCADVVVAANTFEGRPNVVLEAVAAGRPLVVSDIAAHREVLDDSCATWVDATSAASIANGVGKVLDDRAGAERRAAAARPRARAWSIDAMAAEYDRVYRAVLSAGDVVTGPTAP